MNAEASPKPDSITPIATPEQLIAAREARGWSMSDVAAKLGMMPRQIDAIEQGRWEALPGQAFIRGAIRAYGKALQVDVAPLLATLGGHGTPELRPSSSLDSPLPRYGALGFDHGGSGSRIVWILLGVIGVIAIAMYFGRGADLGQVFEPGTQPGRTVDVVPLAPGSSSAGGDAGAARGASGASSGLDAAEGVGSPSASTSTAAGTAGGSVSGSTTAPALTGAAPGSTTASPGSDTTASTTLMTPTTESTASSGSDASAASSPMGTSASAPDEGVVAGSSASAASPSTAAGTASATAAATDDDDPPVADEGTAASAADATGASASTATEPSAATHADGLVMRFERESWVEVRDATGRVLLLGTQPASSTREVSGEKPYSMTIGNAPFVRVEHGGRNVDLGNVTQKGVARLRVE